MNLPTEAAENHVDEFYHRIRAEAEATGYLLNPDLDFGRELAKGILVNERRYGYRSCPCRLAASDKIEDMDIICPCDYRDADIVDYGMCYCGLYVSETVAHGDSAIGSIPERRPASRESREQTRRKDIISSLPYPMWRCRVCGYLCAREQPPEVCPICKAAKERFERFM